MWFLMAQTQNKLIFWGDKFKLSLVCMPEMMDSKISVYYGLMKLKMWILFNLTLSVGVCVCVCVCVCFPRPTALY